MQRVIITGATGAVGTALIQKIIGQGHEVLVICRQTSKRIANIPEHPLVSIQYGSLNQFASLENETGKPYDVLYHLAWDGTTGAARNDMYLQNQNVKHALDAVSMAHRYGCHTFIGAGSQAEYGRVEGVMKPDTPAFPETGYGIAKLCAGFMTREYAHQLGMKHLWVRILSVYGPNDGKNSMIMSTISKLQAGIVPEFTKGEQMWDYLYSGDAAIALWKLPEHGQDGKTYVLGSGVAKPLKDYIQSIREHVAPEAEIAMGAVPYSPKQVMLLKADITDLIRDLDFHPETTFAEGIEQIINGGSRI